MAERQPPNILFLFADDQRPDTLAAYGNAHIQTPHLDRLAAGGFNAHANYCMGSMHGAVCQPSRAMLMSGRTLWRAPRNLEGVPLLPEVLREAGYATFGTGKWHNGADSFARAFEYGQDVFIGGMCDHTQVPVRDLKADGRLSEPTVSDRFSSELFADATIGFLDRHRVQRPRQPFFAYVSFTSPHDPRQPPSPFREMYDPDQLPLPRNYLPMHPFHNGWMTGRDEALAAWPRTPETVRSQLAEYYGMITHLDAQIGRILGALDQNGFSENTVIVFTAHPGLAVGSHGLLGKQNLYEHSMRAPLILRGPGIPAGESTTALTYLFDLFPTLCEIAGAIVPEGVEGRSLSALWAPESDSGTGSEWRQTLFTAYEKGQRAIRDERWKLIRYPLINRNALFDLKHDPDERRDLARLPEHQARIERMMDMLKAWQTRVDDTAPLSSQPPKNPGIDLINRQRKPDRHQPQWIVDKYF